MPYVKVPKDFKNIEKEVVLGLTKRQLVYLPLSIVTGVITGFLTYKIIPNQFLYLSAGVAFPIFHMGFKEIKDGRTAEQRIKDYITARYKMPRTRYYKPNNIYNYANVYSEILEVIKSADSTENKNQKSRPLQRFTKRAKKKDGKADENR